MRVNCGKGSQRLASIGNCALGEVTYLQLAHNERHPVTGSPVAKVIHNFGRADKVDKEALARLASSISRVLDPIGAAPALPRRMTWERHKPFRFWDSSTRGRSRQGRCSRDRRYACWPDWQHGHSVRTFCP